MLMLDFFHVIPTFYGWVFPLNLLVMASILGGIAVGLLPRRGSRVRWIFPVVCLCVMLITEAVWQLYPSEYLILFYVWGWFAEAALFSEAVGAIVHIVWMKARRF